MIVLKLGSLPLRIMTSAVQFSSYRNRDTGKTGIWITPYGSLVMCTDTYPGWITDSDLASDCGVLDMIKEKGTTVLTNKGFGIVTQRDFDTIVHHSNLMPSMRRVT